MYGVLVFYIAWSVPVAIVLGTPMTWTILRAARGPLADSITLLLHRGKLCADCAGRGRRRGSSVLLSRWQRRRSGSVPARWRWIGAVTAALFIVAGPGAAARTDTLGLDRNAVTALVPIGLPVAHASATGADWRASPFPSPVEDVPAAALSALRGSARGFNVLMVVLESTAAQYLRPYGGAATAADDPMPNFTALSQHAVLFDNAYVTYPESIKGLFSILCSRYPAFGLPAEAHATVPCAPVASQLSADGYQTGLFHSGRFGYLGMDALVANKGFATLEDAGAIGGNFQSSFGVDEPATVDRILTWIDRVPSGTPFFAAYLPVAGHHPYATSQPGPFDEASDIGRYKNALHEADAALGSLLLGLRARHIDDRTVVMVFGDHGEAFGQHPGNMGHTMFVNEENVKVPYLIAIPGATREASRVSSVVSLIDTAPTILDLLGLPNVKDTPRRASVSEPGAAAFGGGAPNATKDDGYQGVSMLDPGGRMALFLTDYSLGLLGLRDGCWKYVFEINTAASQLFDICRDPGETTNLAGAEPQRVKAYRDRVSDWSAAQKARVERR